MSGWRRTRAEWSLKLEKKNAALHIITTDLQICFCPWDASASPVTEYKFGWCLWSEARAARATSPPCLLTVLRRRMFSRRAPMQPQKVMKNMTTPTTIRMTVGSMRNVSRTVSAGETGDKTAFRGYHHLHAFPLAFFSLLNVFFNFNHACSLHRLLIIWGLAQDVLVALRGDRSKARLIRPSSQKITNQN